MVVKMAGLGRSFRGVTDYCLHDRRLEGEPHPESSKRVEWTETRNLATSQGERAARIMAATAEAGGELKRLAGVAATGRKLEKPVCHYSLNWAEKEKPERGEMRRAVEGSLQALGMEGHQALIVAHNDGQPHVHVIVNRVDPENGKAAGLSRSKLETLQMGGRIRAGAGADSMPAEGDQQRTAECRGEGSGWPGTFWGAVEAREDEPASRAAGKDSGGERRRGNGLGGLASSGGAVTLGVVSAAAWEGAWGRWRSGASGSGRSSTGVRGSSGSG